MEHCWKKSCHIIFCGRLFHAPRQIMWKTKICLFIYIFFIIWKVFSLPNHEPCMFTNFLPLLFTQPDSLAWQEETLGLDFLKNPDMCYLFSHIKTDTTKQSKKALLPAKLTTAAGTNQNSFFWCAACNGVLITAVWFHYRIFNPILIMMVINLSSLKMYFVVVQRVLMRLQDVFCWNKTYVWSKRKCAFAARARVPGRVSH